MDFLNSEKMTFWIMTKWRNTILKFCEQLIMQTKTVTFFSNQIKNETLFNKNALFCVKKDCKKSLLWCEHFWLEIFFYNFNSILPFPLSPTSFCGNKCGTKKTGDSDLNFELYVTTLFCCVFHFRHLRCTYSGTIFVLSG